MKKLMPLLLATVLLSSTVACQKSNDNTSNASPPASQDRIAGASNTSTTKNQQAIAAAGTNFDTILQQDLSTGKSRNNERFVLKVKNSSLKDGQVQGHLENVVKAARGKKASLNLVFDEIVLKDGTTAPIDATLVNTQVETKTKGKFVQNAGLILGGAVAGHFLGNKAKFKQGALAGGAAATAFVLSSPGGEVVLKKGTNIKLKLTKPLNASP